MGYAMIMFFIMILMALSISLSSNYGVSKDSEEAPLLAQNAYADREGGKGQTDIVVVATKINGTATYTSTDDSLPNLLNLHLNIKNNGSSVLTPPEYSIILNRSWVWINSTSSNLSPPLTTSNVTSSNLTVTPKNAPMNSISLLVSAGNGVRVITPTSPIINYLSITGNKTGADQNCWKDANISWLPSYGEMWPIENYSVYYTDDPNEQVTKNNYNISFTAGSDMNMYIGRAFRSTAQGQACSNLTEGNSTFFIWITATDAHGNEGPPSNTCTATGQGAGTVHCNYPPVT